MTFDPKLVYAYRWQKIIPTIHNDIQGDPKFQSKSLYLSSLRYFLRFTPKGWILLLFFRFVECLQIFFWTEISVDGFSETTQRNSMKFDNDKDEDHAQVWKEFGDGGAIGVAAMANSKFFLQNFKALYLQHYGRYLFQIFCVSGGHKTLPTCPKILLPKNPTWPPWTKNTKKHVFDHNSLNIGPIFNPQKRVCAAQWDLQLSNVCVQSKSSSFSSYLAIKEQKIAKKTHFWP